MNLFLRISSLVLFTLGIVFLLMCWSEYAKKTSFIQSSLHTTAFIDSLSSSETDGAYSYPVYRYTDRFGNEYKVKSSTGYGTGTYTIGDSVAIYYNLQSPDTFLKDTILSKWGIAIVLLISAIIIISIGAVLLIVSFIMKPVPESHPDTTNPTTSTTIQNKVSNSTDTVMPRLNSEKERLVRLLLHLGTLCVFLGVPFGNIFAPLTLWLMYRDQSDCIKRSGIQSINFQLSFTLYAIVCTVTIVGILLLPVLFIFWLVFVIRAMVLDKHQTEYKYPFTIRFIKQH